MGSSPVPGTNGRTRLDSPKILSAKGLERDIIPSRVRQEATVDASFRPLTATENATGVLPADPKMARKKRNPTPELPELGAIWHK